MQNYATEEKLNPLSHPRAPDTNSDFFGSPCFLDFNEEDRRRRDRKNRSSDVVGTGAYFRNWRAGAELDFGEKGKGDLCFDEVADGLGRTWKDSKGRKPTAEQMAIELGLLSSKENFGDSVPCFKKIKMDPVKIFCDSPLSSDTEQTASREDGAIPTSHLRPPSVKKRHHSQKNIKPKKKQIRRKITKFQATPRVANKKLTQTTLSSFCR